MSSLLRRAKSFIVKKETEAVPESPTRRTPRVGKSRRRLEKEKSMSLESVPITLQLEKSQLFRKQRERIAAESAPEKDGNDANESETSETTQNQTRPKKVRYLERRTSRSLDEIRLNVQEDFILRKVHRNPRDTPRCNTLNLCQDLIASCKESDEETVSQEIRKGPGHFPVIDDDDDDDDIPEEVEVRHRSSQQTTRVDGRPKTYNPSVTRRYEETPFEVRGPVSIELENQECIKVFNKETLRVINGRMQLLPKNKLLRDGIEFKPGTTSIGKRDVEMTLVDNTRVIFHFGSQKDARHFIETEKNRTVNTIEKISIKRRLLKLLGKRSSRDILESKGIIKNEPIFGNTLENLFEMNNGFIPEFVTRIVQLIEINENIKSLGLYRTSPNLATLQKIRCNVDCGQLDILKHFTRDPDVLTGALKLFFRELRQPLIPYLTYLKLQQLVDTSTATVESIKQTIDKTMPECHKQTLFFLLRHLIKVCEYKDENKMDFHNMSVSWGPSLIAIPDRQSSDLVIQTTQFHKITRLLLETYHEDFRHEVVKALPTVKTRPQDFVYRVIEKITQIVEAHVNVEGIYRKSGSKLKIDKILKKLHDKKDTAELDKPKHDIFDICCVLKQFLANLEQHLVPNEAFEQFCRDCDKNLDEGIIKQNVRERIQRAPRWQSLDLLLRHLRYVLDQNKINLDTLTNIFVATLMRPEGNRLAKIRYFKILLEENNNEQNQNLPDLLQPQIAKCRDSSYDNLDDDEGEQNCDDDHDNNHDKSATRL